MVVVTLKGNENEGEVKEKRRGVDDHEDNRELMMRLREIDMMMMTLR